METVKVGITETIRVLLEEKKFNTLRDILVTLKPYDIATIFEELQDEKTPLLFRILPKELAAETFVEMDDETQKLLIHGFSDTELKEVVDELFIDDVVDLVEEMPANVVKRILKQADKDTRKTVNELLKYPEDSAGSIMTTEYIVLRPEMTAEQSIKRIRRTGVDKETIYICYVTDDNSKLIGITSVKDLLLSDDDVIVSEIMEENVICVNTLDDQEKVAQMFSNYNFLALPVVDTENRLVGMKCRGVYETPGGTILYYAHQVLETLCLDKATAHLKEQLAVTYAELVYNGQWFTPLKKALDAFVETTQENVTGKVKLKLYKGNMINSSVTSPYSLYSEDIATFGASDYNQKDAEGFINLYGLPIKVKAMMEQGLLK